jgi:hypothetical protein
MTAGEAKAAQEKADTLCAGPNKAWTYSNAAWRTPVGGEEYALVICSTSNGPTYYVVPTALSTKLGLGESLTKDGNGHLEGVDSICKDAIEATWAVDMEACKNFYKGELKPF